MRLYYLRHTEAEAGSNDDKRALTAKGQEDAARLGQFLKESGLSLDAAFASPLVRARETAEIFLKNCGSKLSPQTAAPLSNEVSDQQFYQWIREFKKIDHALLVGHEPSISRRVASLLGWENAGNLSFPKGGLACLKFEDRNFASLGYFISPKLLRAGATEGKSSFYD